MQWTSKTEGDFSLNDVRGYLPSILFTLFIQPHVIRMTYGVECKHISRIHFPLLSRHVCNQCTYMACKDFGPGSLGRICIVHVPYLPSAHNSRSMWYVLSCSKASNSNQTLYHPNHKMAHNSIASTVHKCKEMGTKLGMI